MSSRHSHHDYSQLGYAEPSPTPNTSAVKLTGEHIESIRNALNLIESAQHEIAEAARKLCSVPGLADEWSEVCQLHEQVKAHWHRVEARRTSFQNR